MTDNEIIKALNYCCGNIKNNDEECNEDMCYQVTLPESRDEGTRFCRQWLIKDALELIKRQKAEIEGLEETRYELACIIDELLMCIAEGKETKSAKPIEIKCDDFENKSDFVNVVRCKDCKHCEIADNGRFRKKIYCFQPAPIKQIVETEENRFCSYGGRKEDEGK